MSDRPRAFYPIGSTVLIADRGSWAESYRVVANAPSNLILATGAQLTKWPTVKCRRQIGMDEVQMHVIYDIADSTEEASQIVTRPDPVMIGDSPDHRHARASTDDPPDLPDAAYWVDAANQCSINHRAIGPRWTYAFGSLITSSYCVNDVPCLIDRQYIQPIATPHALPVPGEFILNANGGGEEMGRYRAASIGK